MARLPSLLALLALLCAAVLAGCGGDDAADEQPAEAPAGEAAAACEKVARPAPKPDGGVAEPTRRLTAGTTYVATVSTSCGDFQITLDSGRAPRTGGAFTELAAGGFFDGLTFHRIVPGFVVQGGDPKGTGEGGPGFSVVEQPPSGAEYTKGVVAMAKTEAEAPGTSGSQFFVVTAPDAQLPPDYALLGRVTGGQAVVDRIAGVPTGPDEAPVDPVVIRSIRVAEQPGD